MKFNHAIRRNVAQGSMPEKCRPLPDVQAVKADAENGGWTDEAARHDRVAHALADHLQSLDR